VNRERSVGRDRIVREHRSMFAATVFFVDRLSNAWAALVSWMQNRVVEFRKDHPEAMKFKLHNF
jgi:hypothetical protein